MCLLSFFSLKGQDSTKSVINPIVESDTLPFLRFVNVSDSTVFTSRMLDTSKPTILFYFSTKCEYCEAEMRDIFIKPEKLKDVNLLLVSGHNIAGIKQFLSPYDSVKIQNTIAANFYILKDDRHIMRKKFIYSGVPMFRIYGKNKKLFIKHEGRMTIENLLKVTAMSEK